MTDPDCPHCRALRIQPGTYTVGWWCPTHGDVSYDPTARIRALEAALADLALLHATTSHPKALPHEAAYQIARRLLPAAENARIDAVLTAGT